ncbi:hypothetical protein HJC23_014073 [Cyclotella cryptica]|uniref:Uncharacterized protein n=1 Tax=Cyclotella cryptica TaxID=29204 RepID=A0ABD3QTG2_9STRA|eukprot:CCRYP_002469-RA/>CCRYP_002469-RA protein AED:0.21 eAED:0.21 QI:199/1/1/1/1/1/2/83/398
MIFGRSILSTFLMIETVKLSEGNLFGKIHRPVVLSDTVQRDHDVFVNKEIWNLAEDHIRAMMVNRDDPHGSNVPCSSPSAVWLQKQTSLVATDDLEKMLRWNLYIVPFAYKLYIANPVLYSQEYFGFDGEYTHEIREIYDEAQDFWSGSGVFDEVHLLAAHGSDLSDREKLIPTLELLFEGSYDKDFTVDDHADEIQELISRLPGGYEFPLLTFNAFATDEMGDDIDPSIIIGDGYFQFQKDSRNESEGPEYALTHEFAHHVMNAMGLSLEDYKKEELMADAFAAYFLANNSGGDMTGEEISNIHRVAYSVGDCGISDELHHGTPKERKCATVWGADFADSKEGRKLNARELYARFNTWFSDIDSLDNECLPQSSSSVTRNISAIISLMLLVPWLLAW